MDAYKAATENKIEKSVRNSAAFKKAFERASNGDFDEDLQSASGMPLLKVTEKFVIRELFSLEEGKPYFKLFKEVYYIENPGKYYFEEVDDTECPTVYRRVAGQHESGDKDWANAVSKEFNCPIISRKTDDKKADKKN